MAKRIVLSLLLIAVCLAQTSAPLLPAISAYYRLAGGAVAAYQWVIVDPPLGLSVDSAGSPHLSVTLPPPPPPTPGPTGPTGIGVPGPAGPPGATGAPGAPLTVQVTPGMALVSTTPGSATMMLDTSVFAYRGLAPTAPGACNGAGIWAADATSFYFCVPAAAGGFVWARVPISTTW